VKLRLILILSALLLAIASPAGAQEERVIDVVKLSGPLDERAVDFAVDKINEIAPTSEVIIIQLDSPAALTADVTRLIALVESPPAPVVVWVGPDPAIAYGAAAHLLRAADVKLVAPGAQIGAGRPIAFGTDVEGPALPAGLDNRRTVVGEPISGMVDATPPALLNVVRELDGSVVSYAGGSRTLATVLATGDGDRPIPARFHEPGLIDQTLRLTTSPAVAFFFVLAGLAIAAFEFYAAGVGVAAAVSVVLLFLGGYGLSVLPLNYWAAALAVAGLLLYLYDFQRQQLRVASFLGTVLLIAGGRYLVYEPPHLFSPWWIIVVIVAGIGAFFLFAMTTVVRARFSTPTIGREALIGRSGTAETAIAPTGLVNIEGARWQASSTRASGISPGDPVVVTAVEGVVLEVEGVDVPPPLREGG
jgi:membrane-bound serine protease (ClpP class)